MRSLCILITLATVVLSQGTDFAYAVSKKDPGIVACAIWCINHNKTDHSQNLCIAGCLKYYPKLSVS